MKGQIFMGNGGCKCTGSQIAELYTLLGDTLSMLSDAQQILGNSGRVSQEAGSRKRFKEIMQEAHEGERRVVENAQEIYVALTGQRPWSKAWRKQQKG